MDLWKTKVAGHGRTITIGRAKKFSMGHGLSAQIVESVWLIKRSWSNRNHWLSKEPHGDHLSNTQTKERKSFYK